MLGTKLRDLRQALCFCHGIHGEYRNFVNNNTIPQHDGTYLNHYLWSKIIVVCNLPLATSS
jgi:hypothetical protein